MTRPPCYVMAPFRGDTPAIQAWNIARAAALARLAVAEGLAPVLVHPAIPVVFLEGETEATRAVGLPWALELVHLVARTALGRCYLLTLEDGELSPGVRAEYAAWRQARPEATRAPARRGTWGDFGAAFRTAGLGELHRALAAPPGPPSSGDPRRQVLEAVARARSSVEAFTPEAREAADGVAAAVVREFLGGQHGPA